MPDHVQPKKELGFFHFYFYAINENYPTINSEDIADKKSNNMIGWQPFLTMPTEAESQFFFFLNVFQ